MSPRSWCHPMGQWSVSCRFVHLALNTRLVSPLAASEPSLASQLFGTRRFNMSLTMCWINYIRASYDYCLQIGLSPRSASPFPLPAKTKHRNTTATMQMLHVLYVARTIIVAYWPLFIYR